MTQSGILETLEGVQFLQNVSAELLGQLAQISAVVDFSPGKIVFRQGDPARSIYLIIHGNVALEICASGVGCKRILTVGPGDLLAWSPILEQERLTATARTLEPTRAVEIDGAALLAMGQKHPTLGYEFMKRAALALSKRLTATRMQLVDVYGNQLPQTQDERIEPRTV